MPAHRRMNVSIHKDRAAIGRGCFLADKEFLAAWYARLGYQVIGTGAVEDSHPDLAPLLATPCDFLVYQKDLCDNADGRTGRAAAGVRRGP